LPIRAGERVIVMAVAKLTQSSFPPTLRLGVSLEQVRSVREMAIRVSKAAGVTWFEGVPEAP